jgi:hypothetical protein
MHFFVLIKNPIKKGLNRSAKKPVIKVVKQRVYIYRKRNTVAIKKSLIFAVFLNFFKTAAIIFYCVPLLLARAVSQKLFVRYSRLAVHWWPRVFARPINAAGKAIPVSPSMASALHLEVTANP